PAKDKARFDPRSPGFLVYCRHLFSPAVTPEPRSMLRPPIRKRILAIAGGLIVLMAVTSVLSTVMTRKVAHQLDELSTKYVEAYGHLARMNVRSREQSLAVRRRVIAKTQSPPDDAAFAEHQKIYEAMGLE